MQRRNILFLSTENPYPPDHGHYIRTYNLLKYLARNYNIYFLGYLKKKEDMEHVAAVRELCKWVDVFIMPDDVSRYRFILSVMLNLISPLPYIAQKYYRQKMKKSIIRIIEEQKIDIVHFDMLHLARYRDIVGNIPSVLTEHNVESARILSLLKNSSNIVFKTFMYFQYLKLKPFEKKACSKFDMCITVSDHDMSALSALNPSARYTVIPNGVDTEYFKPDQNQTDQHTLVWAGGMNSLYNAEAVTHLIRDILPIIRHQMPDVKLTVVGKCNSKTILHLAHKHRVTLTGYVDDVRPYIDSSSVYVAPILSGGGTKLKILNALSMAKPVVTTPVGAEGIDVEDGNHLLIANNAGEFAEKIMYLFTNPSVAKTLGDNGRKLIVEKYDWDIIGRKMVDLYDQFTAVQNNINSSN